MCFVRVSVTTRYRAKIATNGILMRLSEGTLNMHTTESELNIQYDENDLTIVSIEMETTSVIRLLLHHPYHASPLAFVQSLESEPQVYLHACTTCMKHPSSPDEFMRCMGARWSGTALKNVRPWTGSSSTVVGAVRLPNGGVVYPRLQWHLVLVSVEQIIYSTLQRNY